MRKNRWIALATIIMAFSLITGCAAVTLTLAPGISGISEESQASSLTDSAQSDGDSQTDISSQQDASSDGGGSAGNSSLQSSAIFSSGSSVPSSAASSSSIVIDDPMAGYKPNTYAPLGKNIMPLGAWISPPPANYAGLGNPDYITSTNYKAIKESGLNFIQAIYERADLNMADVMRALQFADEQGIRYLVRDGQVMAGIDDPELMLEAVDRYKNEPAFMGNMLFDEPATPPMAGLGDCFVNYRNALPNSVFYINLMPTYASRNQLFVSNTDGTGGASTNSDYQNYLDTYIDKVHPRFISYDYYPCEAKFPTLSTGYYGNLSMIRKTALGENIPFWVFIQTCSFGSYVRTPVKADISWQVNTALAYGAKGIQYFTYWTPIESEAFQPGMVTKTGEKTSRYYDVQAINKHIAAIDEVLMNSTSVGLVSNGNSPVPIPPQDLITQYRELTGATGTVPFLIGCFNNAGRSVYYVVNNTVNNTGKVTLNFKSSKSFGIIRKGIRTTAASKQIVVDLEAGEGVLVTG